MKQDKENLNHYIADKGKVIVPKTNESNENATKSIWIGRFDSIENYEEIDEPKDDKNSTNAL